MFVTAVCFLFLLKLKWPKNKNIYDVLSLPLAWERGCRTDEGMKGVLAMATATAGTKARKKCINILPSNVAAV